MRIRIKRGKKPPEKVGINKDNIKMDFKEIRCGCIYKTRILPVVLYGCETWSLTLREEH
jgi:hypothetical protein